MYAKPAQVVKPALQFISGRVTAPSTTMTELTPNSGDSFDVLSTKGRSFIVDMWSKNQTAGDVQVHSPRMHDDNTGYRYRNVTGAPFSSWETGVMQEVFSQDHLTVQQSGSATSGDLEETGLQMYHFNADGIDQNLIHWKELNSRGKQVVSTRHSITGGSSGGYSGEVAINTATNYGLKGNTRYALIGAMIDTACLAIVVKGNNTGNVRLGIPANNSNKNVTRSYFVDLSRSLNLPAIFVMNTSNDGNTTVGVACDENGGTFVIDLLWRLLDVGL